MTKPATIRATQEPEPKLTFQEEEKEEEEKEKEEEKENDVHPKEEVQDRVWSDINEFVIYCAFVCSGTPLLFLFYLEVVTLQKLVAWLTGQDNDKEWNTSCQHTKRVFCIWLAVSHFLVTDVIM